MGGNNPQSDPLVPILVVGTYRSGSNYGEFMVGNGAYAAADGSTGVPIPLAHGAPHPGHAANGRGNSK